MKFIPYLLLPLAAVLAYYSEAISTALINAGWSWTLSKWWIYSFLWILPIFYIFWMRSTQKRKQKIAMPLAFFALSAALAAFHFHEYPIYDGDISAAGVEMQGEDVTDGFNDGLLMISIPGCPYCFEATATLVKLKERKADLPIKQVVLSNNLSDLTGYQEASKGLYTVDTTTNYAFYRSITSMYPTFVLIKDGKMVKQWRNSAFGVLAKDEVEALVE